MFTVPDWRLVSSMTSRNGCALSFEDEAGRGLEMAVWAPVRGKKKTVYAFRSDLQKRRFAHEDAMLRAYEKVPGILCVCCRAIREAPAPGE